MHVHVPFQCWLLLILCLPALREGEGLRETVNHPPGLLKDNGVFINLSMQTFPDTCIN